MNIRKTVALAVVGLVALGAGAKTTSWKTSGRVNNTDWSEPGNFDNGIPEAGDIVTIPEKVTVYATNAAARAVVVTLAKLNVQGWRTNSGGTPGQVVIDVPQGETMTYGGLFGAASVGELVKTGGGTLEFTNDSAIGNFNSSYDVREGTLKFPKFTGNSGNPYFHFMKTGAGATVYIPESKVQFGGLRGAGLITNEIAKCSGVEITQSSAGTYIYTFSGDFHVKASLMIKSGVIQHLTGTNNFFTSAQISGVNNGNAAGIGFTKFGNLNEPSSLGCQGDPLISSNQGEGISYLGDGETANRPIQCYTPTNLKLDGGPNGGLTLTGKMDLYYYSSSGYSRTKMTTLTLSGNGPKPCVIDCNVQPNWPYDTADKTGNICSPYVIKKGTGTWRFTDGKVRSFCSGWAVENGTLQFDSIAERGISCALGDASNPMEPFFGAFAAGVRTPYVFNLGTATTEGTLEYTGEKAAFCSTRPIVLSGNGRLKNSSEYPFVFEGISVLGDGARTLTLDGAGDGDLDGVVDTAANPVSVAKEGAGSWTLASSNVLHGALAVNGGTLTLASPSVGKYTWFRWTIKQTIGKRSLVQVNEFGLFAKDTNARVGANLKTAADWRNLQPGEAAIASDKALVWYGDSYFGIGSAGVEELFMGVHKEIATNNAAGTLQPQCEAFLVRFSDNKVIAPDDPDTWIRVVMRLPDGSPEVGSYDFSVRHGYQQNSSDTAYAPRAWSLEGSTDGRHWTLLHEVADGRYKLDDESLNTSDMHMRNNNDIGYYSSKNVETAATLSGKAIDGSLAEGVDFSGGFSSVTIAGGQLLTAAAGQTISSLTLDGSREDGGLSGFTFPAEGTLAIIGVAPKGRVLLPVSFAGCEGLANLADWTLTVNGQANGHRYLNVSSDGKVSLEPNGLMIIVK